MKIRHANSNIEVLEQLKKANNGDILIFNERDKMDIKNIEKQFSIIEGKYYQTFRNWFEKSCFIGLRIESALYHAYVAGRLDQQVIDSPSKLRQKMCRR